MKGKAAIVPALFLLLIAGYGLSSPVPDAGTVDLSITVTNPSPDEAQEVEVKADLPPELKKSDIISTDGLELKLDPESNLFLVEGKVSLQPSETTFYNVKVRDVWSISPEEVKKVKEEALKFPGVYTADTAKKLDDMLAKHDETTAETHIALYRKENRQLEEIKKQLATMSAGSSAGKSNNPVVFLAVILGVAVAAALFTALMNKNAILALQGNIKRIFFNERRHFFRISNAITANCRLLDSNEASPIVPANNISNGGIAILLEKSFKPQSPVELQIKLPDHERLLTFDGFVVWSNKVTGPDKKERYVTGISFVEASSEDNQALKDYIASHMQR